MCICSRRTLQRFAVVFATGLRATKLYYFFDVVVFAFSNAGSDKKLKMHSDFSANVAVAAISD